MDKKMLEEALKAVVSTNLGLQNSLGNYAEQTKTAIHMLTASPIRESRLARIEENMVQLGQAINTVISLLREKKARTARRAKKK
ncbi:MAG: hypothetical protein U1E51_27025 [Candidatus Binatia bacterium]|nr:hypothetical protein [Candidatus Binatia bacterium]